jgi:hypothetical protein
MGDRGDMRDRRDVLGRRKTTPENTNEGWMGWMGWMGRVGRTTAAVVVGTGIVMVGMIMAVVLVAVMVLVTAMVRVVVHTVVSTVGIQWYHGSSERCVRSYVTSAPPPRSQVGQTVEGWWWGAVYPTHPTRHRRERHIACLRRGWEEEAERPGAGVGAGAGL